ncbi:putative hydrophobic protein (TIGR00341 family) [Virgibacillus natechei]|uniref:Hydrophobic protein (TIGR00341 family) n=1 Tax=Virgibacillus natechei TaxID=1216297 RepID=A0ABS4IJR5_9BACI|nr:TIGR00341 family protein [Virgibacillus natechei]MBP1971093.1 putative hydrophobic protein (TIGR00341 family) [Virgibacillus natechei]UZD12217.1 TIGR00341 family protein [Virgibacillus natechei]
MALQLLEIYAQKQLFDIESIQREFSVVSYWIADETEEKRHTRILVETSDSEEILNYFEELIGDADAYQVMLLPVKTYLPREEDEEENDESKEKELQRASRHELYTAVEESSKMSISYMWFIFFSAVVATGGIIKNSPAIVIGAMVIAPIIGPVTAVSFASILGDFKLIRKATYTSLFGIGLPIFVAALFGFFFNPPIYSDEFLARTDVQIIDVIVALAAGAAGALSFVKRNEGALVGVMVSVALLPPAVVFGMTLGAGDWEAAIVPFILTLVNVNSILLSAVVVFWLSGIKPVNWQELQQADSSRKYSLLFISIICIVLITAIIFINFV